MADKVKPKPIPASDRIDLPDGQWATLRTTFSWGQQNRVSAAFMDIEDGKSTIVAFYAVVAEVVTAWHVLPEEGDGWLDTIDDATFEKVRGATGDAVLQQAMANWHAWKEQRRPLGTTARPAG